MFVATLVDSVPSWRTIWLDHQHAHPAEAPESFLRTVPHLSPSRIGADRRFHDLDAEAVFASLESRFGVDSTIDTLIAVSFLANILKTEMFSTEATALLGPKLRAERERQRTGDGIPVPTPYSDFVHDLVRRHPLAADALREHLDDEKDAELLPHMFMSDLVRAAIVWLDTAEGRESVASLFAALDEAYGHDYEVDLLAMLGPTLRTEYHLERPSHQIRGPRA